MVSVRLCIQVLFDSGLASQAAEDKAQPGYQILQQLRCRCSMNACQPLQNGVDVLNQAVVMMICRLQAALTVHLHAGHWQAHRQICQAQHAHGNGLVYWPISTDKSWVT